ncbi:MAG: TldD/PmbA family protein [Elusimicrobiota bacterium]
MSGLLSLSAQDYSSCLPGCDYGELFLESSRGLSISFEDSRVENIGQSSDMGMSLRFLRRQNGAAQTLMSSAKTFDLETAVRLRKNLLGCAPAHPGPRLEPRAEFRPPIRIRPEDVSLDEKISLLRRLDRLARAEFARIRQVSLSYGENRRGIAILNSDGHYRFQERIAVILSVSIVAEKDGVLQTGRETAGALKGYELLEDARPENMVRLAARRALAKLDAPKAAAGEMPVILASSAGGTFIHEAIGHSLEADHVQEGSSPAYKGKIGKAVAPPTISVIDDPTIPFARGSFGFDDEGIAARPTVLVRNGILMDYLYGRATAMEEGISSNGHGRRESYACRPIPRMSNLYIAPGPDDPRKIIGGIDRGLLVTRMGGGEVNTATGDFVFEVDEGYLIENGVKKNLVRDANLLGVGPETLSSIDKVGWDIGWGIGTCGKDGQGVPVSDAQPSIRIPKLLVGGIHA